jgi:hypothetical protein
LAPVIWRVSWMKSPPCRTAGVRRHAPRMRRVCARMAGWGARVVACRRPAGGRQQALIVLWAHVRRTAPPLCVSRALASPPPSNTAAWPATARPPHANTPCQSRRPPWPCPPACGSARARHPCPPASAWRQQRPGAPRPGAPPAPAVLSKQHPGQETAQGALIQRLHDQQAAHTKLFSSGPPTKLRSAPPATRGAACPAATTSRWGRP